MITLQGNYQHTAGTKRREMEFTLDMRAGIEARK